MRVYVASRFERRSEAGRLSRALDRAGVATTSFWTEHAPVLKVNREQQRRWADRDLADVASSDALVLWNPGSDKGLGNGGRWVEVGYALGHGKPVVVVGARTNLFCFADGVAHLPYDGDGDGPNWDELAVEIQRCLRRAVTRRGVVRKPSGDPWCCCSCHT